MVNKKVDVTKVRSTINTGRPPIRMQKRTIGTLKNATKNLRTLSKKSSGSLVAQSALNASPDVRMSLRGGGPMSPISVKNPRLKLVRTETRSAVDSDMLEEKSSAPSHKN